MTSITTKHAVVHFNSGGYSALNQYIKSKIPSQMFVIVDTNTHRDCLPYFLSQLETNEIAIEIIEIPNGEVHKTIDICNGVWQTLADYNADRKSLILNLGGGVVTDLGGFVASTYMRGIDYINIPTSLLAMVDASVGGKTGVDLGVLKNLVGVFSEGKMVLVDFKYLNTLPHTELVSGFAEMLKHGLIHDADYWTQLQTINPLKFENYKQLIYKSVRIKNTVVSEDPKENGLRKILNFGHTLGHAVESYFLQSETRQTLLHGEAIAIGMILESYLSHHILGLSKATLRIIKNTILNVFEKVEIKTTELPLILQYLKHDKKNSHGNINFVLLEAIGQAKIDCKVNVELIKEAFDFYNL